MTCRTPPDTVIYAVGDIHGRIDLLTAIHALIVADASRREARRKLVIYLGDYVSRGDLDTLGHYGVTIPDRDARDDASVALLRDRFAALLPQAHLDFFRSLPASHRAGDFCFVHGGVRPGVALTEQTDHDCMWIRKPFLESDADHGAVVVHGHCISTHPVVRHNRIGIDTAAYRSGVLTCLALEGATREFLQT